MRALRQDAVVWTAQGHAFLIKRADDHDLHNVAGVNAADGHEPADGSELWWVRTSSNAMLNWIHLNDIIDEHEDTFRRWADGTRFRSTFARADLRAAKANLETIAARFELPSPVKQMGDDEIIKESRHYALARARDEVAHLANMTQAIIERLDACVIHLKSAETAEGTLANERPSAMGEGTHRTNEDSIQSALKTVKKFHGTKEDAKGAGMKLLKKTGARTYIVYNRPSDSYEVTARAPMGPCLWWELWENEDMIQHGSSDEEGGK